MHGGHRAGVFLMMHFRGHIDYKPNERYFRPLAKEIRLPFELRQLLLASLEAVFR